MTTPVEAYTPRRTAEFLLGTAVDQADCEAARAEVRALGLDPDEVVRVTPEGGTSTPDSGGERVV